MLLIFQMLLQRAHYPSHITVSGCHYPGRTTPNGSDVACTYPLIDICLGATVVEVSSR